MTAGTELMENTNVVSLFGNQINRSMAVEIDPLQELLNEAQAEAWETEDEAPVMRAESLLVSESQFPDQSMFVLEKQLSQLTEKMARLKFYISDLDDLLPR
jgi:hypothetical protein